ncbi:MAG: hypothetical protein ACE361_00275 [Aureliella sp.]
MRINAKKLTTDRPTPNSKRTLTTATQAATKAVTNANEAIEIVRIAVNNMPTVTLTERIEGERAAAGAHPQPEHGDSSVRRGCPHRGQGFSAPPDSESADDPQLAIGRDEAPELGFEPLNLST